MANGIHLPPMQTADEIFEKMKKGEYSFELSRRTRYFVIYEVSIPGVEYKPKIRVHQSEEIGNAACD